MHRILLARSSRRWLLRAPTRAPSRNRRPWTPFVRAHHESADERWWKWAACKKLDPDLFNDPDAMHEPDKVAREKAAKAVCDSCVVRSRCLEEALCRDEPQGVWGGMTTSERRALTSRSNA